jgi:hypothetical protein
MQKADATVKKLICQKKDIQKADPSKSRYFAPLPKSKKRADIPTGKLISTWAQVDPNDII